MAELIDKEAVSKALMNLYFSKQTSDCFDNECQKGIVSALRLIEHFPVVYKYEQKEIERD